MRADMGRLTTQEVMDKIEAETADIRTQLNKGSACFEHIHTTLLEIKGEMEKVSVLTGKLEALLTVAEIQSTVTNGVKYLKWISALVAAVAAIIVSFKVVVGNLFSVGES